MSGLLDALDGYVSRDAFDVIVDATTVDEPKPSPAAYLFALDKLGLDAGECVAVEDNVGGAKSAGDAGIACVAFPNENTVEHDFGPVAGAGVEFKTQYLTISPELRYSRPTNSPRDNRFTALVGFTFGARK